MRLVSLFTIQLIITLLFPSHVLSQVNIEKFRESKDVHGFSEHIELDFSSRSGNVDITKLDFESYSNYLWESMNTFLVIRGDYGWQGGKQFSNEGLAHLRHIFRSGADFQPEIFAQIDYNKKRLLPFRGLFGGGLRYKLYKSSTSGFWWGTALMLEHEKLDVDEHNTHEKKSDVIRWSNYISANIDINECVRWAVTTYIQPRCADFKDIRILTETVLQVELSKRVSLAVPFSLRYDSDPPDDIKSLDTSLGTGLVLDF
ncbi:DUF481 domain-containing protein [Candidatus Latescibacterota bacterium]